MKNMIVDKVINASEKKRMTANELMTVYIAGPITGRDRLDYVKHFAKARERLEAKGYTVFDPARISDSLPDGLGHEEYMAICLPILNLCGSIYMLKGWMESLGANRELGYALGRGMNILYEIDELSIDS